MNIVIFHRIPYAKIRYDSVIDPSIHDVTYICPSGVGGDLPESVKKIVLKNTYFDVAELMTQHDALLRCADRFIARSEYDLLPVARLRALYDIAGDLPDDVLPLRDKLLMRIRSKDAGILQPAFWTGDEFLRMPPSSGRYLLKPRLEASSIGIVVGAPAELVSQLEGAQDMSSMLIEELVPGEVFHVDGFSSQGRVLLAVTSVYVGDCLSYARGAPLGSAQTEPDIAAMDLARSALSALNHRDGSFHLEGIRANDGTCYFLEAACRVGGAGVAETFELKTGVNLYHADLHHQLSGAMPHASGIENKVCFGWFVYPGHCLDDVAHLDFDELKWRKNLVSYQRNLQPRETSHRITYASDASPLSGIVYGNSEEARSTLQGIFETTVTGWGRNE